MTFRIGRKGAAHVYPVRRAGDFRGARVGTFAGQATLPTPIVPPTCLPGMILLALDVTPTASGLLLCSFNLTVDTSAPDTVVSGVAVQPKLTSIVGGTVVAPNVIAEPTSTTGDDPAALIYGPASQPTTVVGGSNIASIAVAVISVQAIPGERIGIGLLVGSTNGTTWTTITATASVIEV